MFKMNMKKTIASILAAIMAVSMLSTTVSAKTLYTKVLSDGTVITSETPFEDSIWGSGTTSTSSNTTTTKKSYDRNAKIEDSYYDSSAKFDKISKIQYYGKSLNSKTIKSDAQLVSAIQYASAQGATSIKLNLDPTYKKNGYKKWEARKKETWFTVNNAFAVGGNNETSWGSTSAEFSTPYTTMFVYAYRYGKTDLIKKQDKETQKLYNKCVEILKECGVNDKNKSDGEKVLAIRNWLVDNTVYGTLSKDKRSIYDFLTGSPNRCGAYAKSFAILTRMAGIKSWVIFGDFNGNHIWNAVRVNGELRFIDATNAEYLAKRNNKLYYTYDEIIELKFRPEMTEKELEMYCKY